jgi:hypothetical protein
MNESNKKLIGEVLELCDSQENIKRKELWVRHNNLESEKTLINLHMWKKSDHHVWHEIIKDDEINSIDIDERIVERQLRHKLFKFKMIDDDDIIPSTIWIAPVHQNEEPCFGLSPSIDSPDNINGAMKFRTVIRCMDDLKKLRKPGRVIDMEKTKARVSKIEEITKGLLPVKLILPELGTSPFEYVAQFRSMDDLLYDFYDDPQLIHALMDFFTDCITEDYLRLEKLYGIDPEGTWDPRIHYDRLEDPDKPCTLKNCWAYISAQSAAVISPDMYKEFIHPYHEKIARIFGKVYYHGCEDLTQKAGIISRLPNLRRFHISPWSNRDSILDELGNKFVYEIHVQPSDHLFLHDDDKIKRDIREIALACRKRGATADINLSDIETVGNDAGKLIKWARLAREAVDI